MIFRILAVILFACVAAFPAQADIVYQQPAGSAGTWVSGVDPGGNGFQTFDNFSLATPAGINHVTWRGGTFSTINPPAAFNVTSFRISFWSDSGGVPGVELFGVDIPIGQIISVFQGLEAATTAQIPLNVYEFEATLPIDFNALDSTTYWFSVLASSPSTDPLFAWRPGTGGDNTSVQIGLGSLAFFGTNQRPGDRAFALADAFVEIPEPSAIALFLAALLGMALCGRGTHQARRSRAE